MSQSCKTCRHVTRQKNKQGRPYWPTDWAYPCDAPVELPPLPDSVTRVHGWCWPPSKKSVRPSDGATCPTWAERGKEVT